MQNFLIHFLIILFYFKGFFNCHCYAENRESSENFNYSYSLRRNEGSGLGNKHSYTSINALIFPLSFRDAKAFLDLRYHVQNNCEPYAANFGFGLRHHLAPFNTLLGLNAYYDTKKVHSHFLKQLGIGLEVLGKLFNIRLNGYMPFAKKKVKKLSWLFTGYSDGYFILREDYLKTLRGIDFEVEAKFASINRITFWLSLGAYYYNSSGACKKNIYGTEYTLTALTNHYVTLKLCSTYDNVFKTRIQVQVSIKIPFMNLNEAEMRIFQPVMRNELIVTEKQRRWTSNF